MALPLESTIMAEIGLGQNYSWFNGSGSCGYIRKKAVKRLSDVTKKHHYAAPKEIALPDEDMLNLLTEVANRGDKSEYSLTNTWVAASYIIAHHIHQANAAPEDRQKEFQSLAQYIRTNYL